MKNERTFSDILEYSREVFKNSFKDIIAVNSPLCLFLVLLLYNFHRDNNWTFLTHKLHNLPEIFLIILITVLAYISVLFYAWNIIVIKNNILNKKGELLQSFKEAISKSINVFIVSLIYWAFLLFVALFAVSIFVKVSLLCLVAAVSLPTSIFSIGLILQEGNFKDVFINSARICFANCFKIVSYLIRGMFVFFFPNLCFLVVLYLSLAEEETNKDIEI